MAVMMMPGKVACRPRAIKPQSPPEIMPGITRNITFVKTAFKAPPLDLY